LFVEHIILNNEPYIFFARDIIKDTVDKERHAELVEKKVGMPADADRSGWCDGL
jgi:hypothetical protein